MNLEIASRILFKWATNERSLKDGTPFVFSHDYTARRFSGPSTSIPLNARYLAKHLSSICEAALLGKTLRYPAFQGQGLENKTIMLLYPRGSLTPCAFNLAYDWDFDEATKCIHYGLFMVLPEHQGKGIQATMGFINLILLWREHSRRFGSRNVWFTDLGRSASGSRNFLKFQSNPSPIPLFDSAGKFVSNETPSPKHLAIAAAFHSRFKQDSGMSPASTLENGFVVKKSNSEGGASELLLVNSTTRSRNKRFNNWMTAMCPDKEDELIMVGQFSLLGLLRSEINKQKKVVVLLSLAMSIIAVLVAFFW